jgi:hypothetical protein
MLVLQLLVAVVSVTLWSGVSGLIHDLVISDDARPNFFIENFGFVAGGHLVLNVTGFKVSCLVFPGKCSSNVAKRAKNGHFFLSHSPSLTGQWTAFCFQLGKGGCGLHHQAHRH